MTVGRIPVRGARFFPSPRRRSKSKNGAYCAFRASIVNLRSFHHNPGENLTHKSLLIDPRTAAPKTPNVKQVMDPLFDVQHLPRLFQSAKRTRSGFVSHR
jgi:hypothetical protein